MIYCADDYIEKYQASISYIIEKAITLNFSLSFIERTIAYSQPFSELERSNVTLIAFDDSERLFKNIFKDYDRRAILNNDTIYSWLAFVYIHLFLKFKVTFEMLFIALPIEKALSLFHLYHEIDITQVEKAFVNAINPSNLSCVMNNKKVSTKQLSNMTGIPFATIRSLKYGYRSLDKFEANKLVSIAFALNVKVETLLSSIPLNTD